MATENPSAPESISVEIYDQVYRLRGTDPDHIALLANLVDSKMRAVATQASTVDSLRVAVLAALNIADELVALREHADSLAESQTHLKSRTSNLSGLLDAILEDDRRAS